jgi:hypothetical protein
MSLPLITYFVCFSDISDIDMWWNVGSIYTKKTYCWRFILWWVMKHTHIHTCLHAHAWQTWELLLLCRIKIVCICEQSTAAEIYVVLSEESEDVPMRGVLCKRLMDCWFCACLRLCLTVCVCVCAWSVYVCVILAIGGGRQKQGKTRIAPSIAANMKSIYI